jgi:ATP-dependent Clp protease adaptor protein ClpS
LQTGDQRVNIVTAHWTMAADTPEDEGDFGVTLESRPKTKRPPLYKVLILTEDDPPMEGGLRVLARCFGLTHQESLELMLTVHTKGLAVVGVYSREIAETKVAQVLDMAQRHEHPLQCTMEKE